MTHVNSIATEKAEYELDYPDLFMAVGSSNRFFEKYPNVKIYSGNFIYLTEDENNNLEYLESGLIKLPKRLKEAADRLTARGEVVRHQDEHEGYAHLIDHTADLQAIEDYRKANSHE